MFTDSAQLIVPELVDVSSIPILVENSVSTDNPKIIVPQSKTESESEIISLKKALVTIHEQNIILKNANRALKTENNKIREENEGIQKLFSSEQLKKLQNCKKRIYYKADDIAKAISLHSAGAKAYRWLLKNNYPFPAESTLRRWANKIRIEPGILHVVLNLMKNANMTVKQRVCVLMADEMKIKKVFDYDRATDTVLGPSNYVQVVMARGLFHNWKQPIFFDYDCQLKEGLLFSLIRKLEEINFNVVAVVSDMGGGNRKLWKLLNISNEKPFFKNPFDATKKVFVFPDAPHLVKLMRNHFLDSGFEQNGKKITKGSLVELLSEMDKSDLKIASKFKNEHLQVNGAGRQKVKLATQLFSHTYSCAITRLASFGLAKSEDWLECADLLKKVT